MEWKSCAKRLHRAAFCARAPKIEMQIFKILPSSSEYVNKLRDNRILGVQKMLQKLGLLRSQQRFGLTSQIKRLERFFSHFARVSFACVACVCVRFHRQIIPRTPAFGNALPNDCYRIATSVGNVRIYLCARCLYTRATRCERAWNARDQRAPNCCILQQHLAILLRAYKWNIFIISFIAFKQALCLFLYYIIHLDQRNRKNAQQWDVWRENIDMDEY